MRNKLRVAVIAVAFAAAIAIGGKIDGETMRLQRDVFTTQSDVVTVDGEKCVDIDGNYFAFDDNAITDGDYVSVTIDTHGTSDKTAWTVRRVDK